MSTETPVIRNFLGLEGLEQIARGFELVVNMGYGNQVTIESGDIQPVAPGEIRDVGLLLMMRSDLSSLLEAVGKAGLRAENVSLYVISEGRFLKNRDVIYQGPVIELSESISISPWKSPRPDSMNDRRHGFDIHCIFALNKQIGHVPLRPRRLGTVLAECNFGIRPTKLGNGLVPLPLTDEVRGDRLPKGTVLYVEPVGELFEAESLDTAVTIYIDEELHGDLGTLKTKESKLLQVQLALEALAQIVFLASAELAEREITSADEESVIGQYLFTQLQKVSGSSLKEPREALMRVKTEPTIVAAQLTAQGKHKTMLRSLLRGEGDWR